MNCGTIREMLEWGNPTCECPRDLNMLSVTC